ncbi:MAG: hypothetical protein ACLQPV_00070 [Vulcanimicrobiaceae bacterium]
MSEIDAHEVDRNLSDAATGPPPSAIIETRDEYLDFSKLPESKGIPSLLPILALAGLIAVAIIAGSVISVSGYGHYWPSDRTLRVPLAAK